MIFPSTAGTLRDPNNFGKEWQLKAGIESLTPQWTLTPNEQSRVNNFGQSRVHPLVRTRKGASMTVGSTNDQSDHLVQRFRLTSFAVSNTRR